MSLVAPTKSLHHSIRRVREGRTVEISQLWPWMGKSARIVDDRRTIALLERLAWHLRATESREQFEVGPAGPQVVAPVIEGDQFDFRG